MSFTFISNFAYFVQQRRTAVAEKISNGDDRCSAGKPVICALLLTPDIGFLSTILLPFSISKGLEKFGPP